MLRALSEAETFDRKLNLCAALESASTPKQTLILVGKAVQELTSELELEPEANLEEIRSTVAQAYRTLLEDADEDDREAVKRSTQTILERARKLAVGIENYESYSPKEKLELLSKLFTGWANQISKIAKPEPWLEESFMKCKDERLAELKKDIARGERKLALLEELSNQ